MKKSYLSLFTILTLVSCNSKEKIQIVAPNGTPAIAIANYAVKHKDAVSVISPAELPEMFTNETKDIIVAPVNLGTRFYNASGAYGFYRTVVWDNIFLVSHEKIESIHDLEGKKIASFGQGNTPQIIFDTILEFNNVECTVEYQTEVANSNALYTAGSYDYVISAQPTIPSVKKEGDFVLSLTNLWQEATGLDSYPQAGIFVKKERFNALKSTLDEIDKGYDEILEDVATTAKNASSITTFKEQLLNNTIPSCGFKTLSDEKEVVKEYLNILLTKGGSFAQSIGGKLPDEGFYLR